MQNFSEKQLSFDNEMARQIISQRSKSAPQRKKWFKRVTTQEPMNSFLMDQMITTRLVNAVNIWHDIHSNLIQLNVRNTRSVKKNSIQSDYSDCAQSDTCISYNHNFDDSLSIESLSYDSIPDYSFSESDRSNDNMMISSCVKKKLTSSSGNPNILDDIECSNLLSEQMVNTEEGEWDKKNVLNSSMITKDQMKITTPELSDHWR